jgi:hypothetical protein
MARLGCCGISGPIANPGRNDHLYNDRLPIPHETTNGVSADRSEVPKSGPSARLEDERLREDQPDISVTAEEQRVKYQARLTGGYRTITKPNKDEPEPHHRHNTAHWWSIAIIVAIIRQRAADKQPNWMLSSLIDE